MARLVHVAVIPDGARRWARRENVGLQEAYGKTMGALGVYIELFFSIGIEIVSIFLLSKANLQRPPEELDAVLVEEERFCTSTVPLLCSRWDATARIAGTPELLPDRWKHIGHCVKAMSSLSSRKLNLCIAYDPVRELLSALESLSREKDDAGLMGRLWVSDSVDLLIRTGGATTLSNFLPLQCGYARIVFLEELFNDTSADLMLGLVRQHEGLDLKYGW